MTSDDDALKADGHYCENDGVCGVIKKVFAFNSRVADAAARVDPFVTSVSIAIHQPQNDLALIGVAGMQDAEADQAKNPTATTRHVMKLSGLMPRCAGECRRWSDGRDDEG